MLRVGRQTSLSGVYYVIIHGVTSMTMTAKRRGTVRRSPMEREQITSITPMNKYISDLNEAIIDTASEKSGEAILAAAGTVIGG